MSFLYQCWLCSTQMFYTYKVVCMLMLTFFKMTPGILLSRLWWWQVGIYIYLPLYPIFMNENRGCYSTITPSSRSTISPSSHSDLLQKVRTLFIILQRSRINQWTSTNSVVIANLWSKHARSHKQQVLKSRVCKNYHKHSLVRNA